jgi:hypothetical protein
MKFYLAPILNFKTYKQFILSELNQKSNSGKQITDDALKRAAWVTGGVYRSIQNAIENGDQLFVEAAEMNENQFKWSLNELINKWSPETMNELWKPSPLWTILLMFDQKSPSNEVTLLSPSLPDFVFIFRSIFSLFYHYSIKGTCQRRPIHASAPRLVRCKDLVKGSGRISG